MATCFIPGGLSTSGRASLFDQCFISSISASRCCRVSARSARGTRDPQHVRRHRWRRFDGHAIREPSSIALFFGFHRPPDRQFRSQGDNRFRFSAFRIGANSSVRPLQFEINGALGRRISPPIAHLHPAPACASGAHGRMPYEAGQFWLASYCGAAVRIVVSRCTCRRHSNPLAVTARPVLNGDTAAAFLGRDKDFDATTGVLPRAASAESTVVERPLSIGISRADLIHSGALYRLVSKRSALRPRLGCQRTGRHSDYPLFGSRVDAKPQVISKLPAATLVITRRYTS